VKAPGPRRRPEKPAALLLAAFLALLPGRGGAQEREAGYYVEETGGGPRFVQRFSWEPEEYASRYEVRVERREDTGNWTRVLAEFTADNFIELSLSPGSYRYVVQAHDLMERPSGNPEWIYVEVLPALQPVLKSFSPDRLSLDELDRPEGRAALTLTVRGRNLAAAMFRLVPGEGEALLPLRVLPEASGERVVLTFGGERLFPGNYELRMVNPGGLSASGTLRVSPPKKTMALSVSAGYEPLIPLYGGLHELLTAPAFPIGAGGRVSFLPVQTKFIDIGMETALHWTYVSSRYDGGTLVYDVTSHFLGLEAYGLFQKNLTRRLSLNLRLGGGLFAILGFEKETAAYHAGQVNVLVPAAGGGLSLRRRFFKFLFAELGAEYTHFFSVDDPPPGYVRPFLGIGYSR
jgi:hypothetical protein